MLLALLDNLRTKSLRDRRRAAAIGAGTCTALLFLVWLGFGPLGPADSASRAGDAVASDAPGPLSALGASLGVMWQELAGNVSKMGEAVTELGDVIAGEVASSTTALAVDVAGSISGEYASTSEFAEEDATSSVSEF